MTTKKPVKKQNADSLEAKAKGLLNTMSDHLKDLKAKYDNLDQPQKKRLLKGIGAAAAVLAGIGLASKIVKSKTGRK